MCASGRGAQVRSLNSTRAQVHFLDSGAWKLFFLDSIAGYDQLQSSLESL